MSHDVDVVVVGGSLGGVAAAAAAAESGCRVLLVAPRPYLGDDLCATLRLWLEEGEAADGALTAEIFGEGNPATPLGVKKILDRALLDAGVEFVLGSLASGVLVDDAGRPAGIVMSNRAGRQAVKARVIIDATERATVARLAGAPFDPWPAGAHRFQRVVVGGQGASDLVPVSEVPLPSKGNVSLSYYLYELDLDLPDSRFSSFAAAEQQARDRSYRDGQLRASEHVFQVPPDPMRARCAASEWKGLDKLDAAFFQPRGVDGVYVIGGCAGVDRHVAASLSRPSASERVGRFIGKTAANVAQAEAPPVHARVRAQTDEAPVAGEVRELLAGLRPSQRARASVLSPDTALPVLGQYQVVIVGGGTSGAPAAIAAARQGASVLVLEYQEGLGGVGTVGLIGKPYHGKKIGFSKEVPFPDKTHNVEHKMEWYRREILKAGGDIWFGVLGNGAVVEDGVVKGVVVATPHGRGVVLADITIDATGNADIAAAAGAPTMYGATEDGMIAMQGAGLPVRPLGDDYVNTDYLVVDETDMVDVWRAFVGSRQAMRSTHYDSSTFIQTRERRRIVGDHVLTYIDQIARRTYPDSIVYSASDYDSHGYPSDPYFGLLPHDDKSREANHPAPSGSCYTPYRCLLPRGLEGILVVGLGISMKRDAAALMRMQYDIQNQGYAAGVAAAMAAKYTKTTRGINVRELQSHLVELGSLNARVLEQDDSFPLDEDTIARAVTDLASATNPTSIGYPLAVVLSHRERALPLLKRAYAAEARDDARITYAKVLGFLGQPDGVSELLAALDAADAWDPRIKQGNMAEYGHLPTPIDSLILALGYAGDSRALPALVRKVETLDTGVALSHHRSLALALEHLADPAAAAPLARLLQKPGMQGHAERTLVPVHDWPRHERRRIPALREIMLARALYRCGDHAGLGRSILEAYRHDLRGLFAGHAAAVLESGGEQR